MQDCKICDSVNWYLNIKCFFRCYSWRIFEVFILVRFYFFPSALVNILPPCWLGTLTEFNGGWNHCFSHYFTSTYFTNLPHHPFTCPWSLRQMIKLVLWKSWISYTPQNFCQKIGGGWEMTSGILYLRYCCPNIFAILAMIVVIRIKRCFLCPKKRTKLPKLGGCWRGEVIWAHRYI